MSTPAAHPHPRWRGLVLVLVLVAVFLVPGLSLAGQTTADDAREVVEGWLGLEDNPLEARLSKTIRGVSTRYDKSSGEAVYHVVALSPEGFVIISGDDRIEPIIAFQAAGSFDTKTESPLYVLVNNDLPGRLEGVRSGLKTANGLSSASDPQSVEHKAKSKWDSLKAGQAPAIPKSQTGQAAGATNGLKTSAGSLSDIRVAPILSSKWGQTTAGGYRTYNYYTPSYYYAGCVATAMAQVMRLHQHPTTGVGTAAYTIYVNGASQSRALRGGDGAGGTYSWANMPLAPNSSSSDTQRRAIGALLHDAGVAAHMQYSVSSSGAYMGHAAIALRDVFQYANVRYIDTGTNLAADVRNRMINPNLDAGLPVLLGISRTTGGHAVVADGYGYNASTLYTHVNMGWDGYADLWYNLPTVDSGSYTYTSVDAVIYNVYKTGSGEIVSGRVLDGAMAPVSGAVVTATASGGTTYQATTNAKGIYALVKLPSATTFTLAASKVGLNFESRSVTTGTSTNGTTSVGNQWGMDITVAAPEGVSPTGSIAESYPDFSWPETSGATQYRLYVSKNGKVVLDKWYLATDIVKDGVCSVADPYGHATGSYAWWVQAWNPSGLGPWSRQINYTVAAPAAPAAATMSAPAGTVAAFTPTIAWKHAANATHYYLQINKGSTVVYKKWHVAENVDDQGNISIASPVALSSGSYKAWVQSWNPSGYGQWSPALSFTVSAPLTSGTVQMTAPSGAQSTGSPTFSWTAAQNATWYFLQINKGSKVFTTKWLTAEEVASGQGCSATSPAGHSAGTYTAWARPWNPNGYGAWSTGISYTVSALAIPGKATLTAPAASVNAFYPTLAWPEIAVATQYQVQINKGSTVLSNKWYTTEQVCADGDCALVSPAAHVSGSYTAWVRTWNPAGYGPWSAAKTYTVTAPAKPGAAF